VKALKKQEKKKEGKITIEAHKKKLHDKLKLKNKDTNDGRKLQRKE
jgi:hypothetical protein